MRNNNSTIYALDNDTGEFKKGDIKLAIIRVNGEHIGEKPIEAERKSKTLLQTSHTRFQLYYQGITAKENRLENVRSNSFYICVNGPFYV